MIFTRSFVGIRFFGFRLGELMVGFGLLIILMFLISQIFLPKKFEFFPTNYYLLLLVSFFVSLFINKGNLFNLYTFKSSSYLWMVGYVIIGYFFFSNFVFNKLHIYILMTTPYIVYIFNSGNYPNFIIDFFNKFSDKFQFNKGSDVLMVLIFCLFVLKNKFEQDINYLNYTNISFFLLLPLFLTLSRASFFAALLFMVLFNLYQMDVVKQNKKKYYICLILGILFFIISAIRLAALPDIESRSDEPVVIQVVSGSVSEVAQRKNTFQFLGFYLCEDRICAKDNTLDWRFDIWFDLVQDQVSKNKLLFGFGFNEIFEVMKDPQAPGRLGRDGLNEHVHNHIFTIIGRFGLLGLFLYFLFQYKLIREFRYDLVLFLVPLFLVSMIDTTMESIQFPYLYYFLIGYYLNSLSKK